MQPGPTGRVLDTSMACADVVRLGNRCTVATSLFKLLAPRVGADMAVKSSSREVAALKPNSSSDPQAPGPSAAGWVGREAFFLCLFAPCAGPWRSSLHQVRCWTAWCDRSMWVAWHEGVWGPLAPAGAAHPPVLLPRAAPAVTSSLLPAVFCSRPLTLVQLAAAHAAPPPVTSPESHVISSGGGGGGGGGGEAGVCWRQPAGAGGVADPRRHQPGAIRPGQRQDARTAVVSEFAVMLEGCEGWKAAQRLQTCTPAAR